MLLLLCLLFLTGAAGNLLLGVFVTLHCCGLGEIWVALGTLLSVGLYVGILFCFRHRLQKKFTFRLSR